MSAEAKTAECCGAKCYAVALEDSNPCWGEVVVVDMIWFGESEGETPVHACEGHKESWEGGEYRRKP